MNMFSRLIPQRLNLAIFSTSGRLCFPALQCNTVRLICDRGILKMDLHEREKVRFAGRVKDVDAFWLRILEMQDAGKMYEEDLKTAWFLAQEEHLPTLIQVSEKYIKGAAGKSTFGSFKFAPVMMRTCLDLNKPGAAIEIFQNPVLSTTLDDAMTIIILMDFLIESEHISDALQVYEWVEKLEWFFVLRHPLIPILYSVALYKQGTLEALTKLEKFAQKLVARLKFKQKVEDTMAALALKLKDSDRAIQYASKRSQEFELAWNIKIQANILKNKLDLAYADVNLMKHHRLYQDTVKLLPACNTKTTRNLQFKTAPTTIENEILAPLRFQDYQDVLIAPKRKFYM